MQKIIYRVENILSRIFNSKRSQILACLVFSLILILLNIMLIMDEYSFNNFLILSLFILLSIILIDIVCIGLEIFDKHRNRVISKKIKLMKEHVKFGLKKSLQKERKKFHSASEMIFYYGVIYSWIVFYLSVNYKLDFIDNIVHWSIFLLFCAVYRLMLHIIYRK